ncbi:hypothetical protein [Mycolicibacterium helvum]|nr:hypothetical protein [Mycolicibacterium helvum]
MEALPAAAGVAAVAAAASALRRYLSAREALAAVPAALRCAISTVAPW